MTKNTELAIFQQISPIDVFKENKVDDFLSGVEKEVEEFKKIRDISTLKGRAEIKSFAFRIAQTKAPLDKAGLSLTEEMRDRVKLINAERSRIKDKLENFQNDVRKPLTDFEDVEKERVKVREDRIIELENASYVNECINQNLTAIAFYKHVIVTLDNLFVFDWQEFLTKAEETYNKSKIAVEEKLKSAVAQEREKVELEKLRKKKEEMELKEREAQISKEATEKAQRIAKEEAQRIAKIAEDEKYKLEAEKKSLELAKIEAERKAIYEKKLAEEREINYKEQAEKEKKEAIEIEKLRVEAERKIQEKADEARARNVAHKTKIHNEILKGLSDLHSGNVDEAKDIIRSIALGRIPHLFIKY